jgi:peptidyl-prolyl cis-trans isomerase A (cyclophilin A)
MLRRTLLAAAIPAMATVAYAQTPAPAATTPPPAAGKPNPKVKIETAIGDITLELYADKAPITVANYLHYVDTHRFDGSTFYRTSKPDNYDKNDYGVVQGGLQNDPKKLFPPIAHEPTSKTGLKHVDGTISMGRRAPGRRPPTGSSAWANRPTSTPTPRTRRIWASPPSATSPRVWTSCARCWPCRATP